MLTLDVLDRIQLSPRPKGQMAVGWILRASHRNPINPTKVTVERLDRVPSTGRVYLAMNHTDRYNYFPFQVQLWKQREEFTATWVKGKYYNNPWIQRFMTSTSNIPAPSKGYIITADAIGVLGKPPSDDLYRVVRDALDGEQTFDEAMERATEAGVADDLRTLNDTPRDMLGYRYRPSNENYLQAVGEVFFAMMDRFVALNHHAFDIGLKVLVFPEGTRSQRLGVGRPGLAQMAVRTGATIVPIGCNNSDLVYPGDSPVPQGGHIVYRVGEPLTPDGELAPYQNSEPFRPFTREADPFRDTFEAVTDLVMSRIEPLLDERHLPEDEVDTVVSGAKRFV
jgi:1-acyl-sn-glycerol-3-phosphate acyltransferase